MTEARILVVEDEGIVAIELQEILEGLGYDVPVVVATGEEAIEETENTRPDLVLMDITLEGDMDGIEATERIRARFDIPVIYLTAYADDKTLQRAAITEPAGYLLKPFDEGELRTTIEIALYKHRARRGQRRHDAILDTAIQGAAIQRAAIQQPSPAKEGQRQADKAATAGRPPVRTEPTILLIEDDPLSASLVELTLSSEGYQVLTASNGLQGLKVAHTTFPDLVLLDLMLPGLDGFEVLNRLRNDPQMADVPVVILSAKAQSTDKRTADRMGADAYVNKTYEDAELLDQVRSLLEGKRSGG